MSTPHFGAIRWFRFSTALAAAAAVCYLVYLGLLGVPVDHTDYTVVGSLAVCFLMLASKGDCSRSRRDLLRAVAALCLVISGSLVGHSLYLWYRCLGAVSTNGTTTLIRLSAISSLTYVCLAPAVVAMIATFELGRRHIPGGWRWAYVMVVGASVALFAVRGYLRIGS